MLDRLTSKSLQIALTVLGGFNFYTPRAYLRLPQLDYQATFSSGSIFPAASGCTG